MLIVTTSWDDGDALDERLSRLLDTYSIRSTFYMTREYRTERLSDEGIKELALRHEVGAHTLTHPDLRSLSRQKKKEEIAGSKQWLEEILQKNVEMFCYPSGYYDKESQEVAQEAGFIGARTTEPAELTFTDSYLLPTTLQVYPVPFRKIGPSSYWWGKLFEPLTERAPALRKLGVPLVQFRSFETLAKTTFDLARARGGIFHLWGHSWEIDRYGMWKELERVLAYIGNRPDCSYLTNGQTITSSSRALQNTHE